LLAPIIWWICCCSSLAAASVSPLLLLLRRSFSLSFATATLEGLRETLHLHAEHYELIHGHLFVALGVALLHQEVYEFGRESKAHLGEGCQQVW